MTTVLTLGGVLFSDFEVPEKINFGGQHELVTHKLPGGKRIIDAMGPDDDDRAWSGRFRGPAAEIRARSVDFMRQAGKPVDLIWSTFRYKVLIRSFKADFQQTYEIPYQITCEVVTDETSPLLNTLLSMDLAIGSDLNGIVQIGASLGLPGLSTAIAGLTSITSTVQSFEGASTTVLSGVQGAISTVTGVAESAFSSADGLVSGATSVAGMVGGLSPATLINSLTSQATAFSSLGDLSQIKASLGRLATNVGSLVS